MNDHPISELMLTTMQKIREIVDVNTIIGEPIIADEITLIPVSKMSVGFGSGGSDYQSKDSGGTAPVLFGGGGAAGVSVVPVAFIVISGGNVRTLSITPPQTVSTLDHVLDIAPEIMDKIKSYFDKNKSDPDKR